METLQGAERLTIVRARSIVEHAEAVFAEGRLIPDAFDPFSSAGAIDRQEAFTALLLVVADYFASVSGLDRTECERYEEYVRLSRSIAIRIICDGVKHSETAIAFMRDCGSSFDLYTKWLSLQDPSKNTFWPLVYKRLNIDSASARVLQAQTIQSLDMDQLIELVGCVFQMPSDEGHSCKFGFEIHSGSRNSQYITSKSEGISILLEESVLSAIFLYTENGDGYSTFPRQLSEGITFGARRSKVRKALGQPDEISGIAYIYDYGKYKVTFEFREWLGTLKFVVIHRNSCS